jgi:hypothetical protein
LTTRNHKGGIVLLSTLITVLLLATLAAALQQRAQNNIRVMARLESAYSAVPERDAVFERLRGLVADAMMSDAPSAMVPALNGAPFRIAQGARDWEVRVQDVQGIVDIYLAPPEVIGLLPGDADAFIKAREAALDSLPLGARFPTVESSLAQFGVDPREVTGLATQSATAVGLRITQVPQDIRVAAEKLSPSAHISGQVQVVQVTIHEATASP